MNALKIVTLVAVVLVVSSCAQLPKDYEIDRTTAITGTDDTALGLRSIAVRQEQPDKSRLIPLTDGVDGFYARAALAIMAERSLDIQYFLWHKDLTGQFLLKLVLDAADRGVRVRILLDDLDNQELDPEFYALDTHPNISIRLFNPFVTRSFKYIDFLTDTTRINRRMHNKSFTADNQYTIVGGRNLGDEYFDAEEDTNFYDMDVLATGPVVSQVSNAFDVYWNHEIAVPVYAFEKNTATAKDLENLRIRLGVFVQSNESSQYADDARSAKVADALRGGIYPDYTGDAEVIYDDPDKGLGKPLEEITIMRDLLDPYLQNVKREVVFISPYFVPGDSSVEELIAAVKRGISVAVITNSYTSTDSGAVHAGYSRYRKALLKGGVELYELKPSSRKDRPEGSVAFDSEASLHTKAFILDRETVFIGSLNLDPRSIDINTEMGIVFHSREMAEEFVRDLDKGALQHVYELKLVRSPAESKGEFTAYTWNIEWLERVDGETIRHTSEPGVGGWERFMLFLNSLVPESLI
ncbi:MAG: phospholipase D family protein [Rhodothermia bacterium]|nr:MAG: phospholipase D family protein [Rhodothermia bacterium]